MNHSNNTVNALQGGLPCYPRRMLTEDEIRQYDEDGVILLKGAVEPNWVALVEEGIEESLRAPAFLARMNKYVADRSPKYRGFRTDLYMWKRIDAFRDAVYYGPFARWAQQIMKSDEVRLFVDQVFVKQPGTEMPTPWHQDGSFLPVRGAQMCSMWMPVDSVKKENSLMFVKGSHRWGQAFKAFSGQLYSKPMYVDERNEEIPDINANLDKYEVLSWDTEPGDILLFNIRTLHGAYGNNAQTTRRALALKWTGDDVVYDPSRGAGPNRYVPYAHHSLPGGPLRGAAFPRILPKHDPGERAARMRREGRDLGRVADGLWHGIAAVGRWLTSARGPATRKQTWDRPAPAPLRRAETMKGAAEMVNDSASA